MPAHTGPKPTVEFNGRVYSCKRYKVEIPDLASISDMAAIVWLNQNTAPRGWSKAKPNLAGLTMVVR